MVVDYNSKEFIRSRNAYSARCAFEHFIGLLMTDAYLAKLLTRLNISDSLIGIISSLVSLAFITQAISVLFNKKTKSIKRTVIIFDTLGHTFFFLLYLIPFLPIGGSVVKLIAMSFVLLGYILKYYVFGMAFSWGNSFVEPTKRATYSAVKEIISLSGGIVFTLIAGYFFDVLEAGANPDFAYLLLAVLVLVINLAQLIAFFLMDDRPDTAHTNPNRTNKSMSDVLKKTLGNVNYRKVVTMNSLLKIGSYFFLGYIGVFKTKDLLLSVFVIQIINIASNFLRMAVSIPFGRFSDRQSFAKGYLLGLVVMAIGLLFGFLTTKTTWYFIIVFTVLYNISQAGTTQNSFNIMYSFVDADYITEALCIDQCISGILGFIASLFGGVVLKIIQSNNSTVFGIHIYAQQILMFISFLIIIIDIIFIYLKILPVKENNRQ